jgi:hypothetical protein
MFHFSKVFWKKFQILSWIRIFRSSTTFYCAGKPVADREKLFRRLGKITQNGRKNRFFEAKNPEIADFFRYLQAQLFLDLPEGRLSPIAPHFLFIPIGLTEKTATASFRFILRA